MKSTIFRLLPIAALTSMLWACGGDDGVNTPPASTSSTSGSTSSTSSSSSGTPSSTASGPTLLVSRSVYDPANVVSGTLPFNATPETTNTAPITAVSPGTFPNVFTNVANDANFGVTAEVYLDQWAPGATSATQFMDVTATAKQSGVNFSTSFSSKSEMSLSVSSDQSAITFVGYNTAIDQIDASNSNTPGVVDPTNTDIQTPTYRTVGQLNLATSKLSFTNTNAYAGNNGRAAVLENGTYYIVGNAGNSGKSPKPSTAQLDMLSLDTGVQSIAPGSACAFTQVIGAFTGTGSYATAAAGAACSLASMGTITSGSSTGDQFGFSIAALSTTTTPVAADKTGKDMNLRSLFVGPDGTMYVAKGSGGNGVNTVYQVGATGALANGGTLPANAPITVVPGFPTTLATNLPASLSAQVPLSQGVMYPFGMWIPSSNTSLMFVADEGDGVSIADASIGSGGLWVYQKSGSSWTPIAHLTQGLNLGQAYTVTDTAGTYGTAGANYTTTPDGLRNITGQVNSDGSITIYAISSTIGNSLGSAYDAGADSNQLVKITVNVNGSTVTTSGFTVMQTAPYGQVLRGVALVPKV